MTDPFELAKSKRGDHAKEAGATVVGSAAAQGGYQAAGYETKHWVDRHTRKGNPGVSPEQVKLQDKALRENKSKYGMHLPHGDPARSNVGYHRAYPTSLPHGRVIRTLGYTHEGRLGVATGAALTALGGAAALGAEHHHVTHRPPGPPAKLLHKSMLSVRGAARIVKPIRQFDTTELEALRAHLTTTARNRAAQGVTAGPLIKPKSASVRPARAADAFRGRSHARRLQARQQTAAAAPTPPPAAKPKKVLHRQEPISTGLIAETVGAGVVGAGAAYGAHRVRKADDGHRVGAGALGAVAGAGVADAAHNIGTQALKARTTSQRKAGWNHQAHDKVWAAHRKKFGVTQVKSGTGTDALKMFRTYPKALPGWRGQRALAHLASPKATAAIVGGGALAGAALAARPLRHRDPVAKSGITGAISRPTMWGEFWRGTGAAYRGKRAVTQSVHTPLMSTIRNSHGYPTGKLRVLVDRSKQANFSYNQAAHAARARTPHSTSLGAGIRLGEAGAFAADHPVHTAAVASGVGTGTAVHLYHKHKSPKQQPPAKKAAPKKKVSKNWASDYVVRNKIELAAETATGLAGAAVAARKGKKRKAREATVQSVSKSAFGVELAKAEEHHRGTALKGTVIGAMVPAVPAGIVHGAINRGAHDFNKEQIAARRLRRITPAAEAVLHSAAGTLTVPAVIGGAVVGHHIQRAHQRRRHQVEKYVPGTITYHQQEADLHARKKSSGRKQAVIGTGAAGAGVLGHLNADRLGGEIGRRVTSAGASEAHNVTQATRYVRHGSTGLIAGGGALAVVGATRAIHHGRAQNRETKLAQQARLERNAVTKSAFGVDLVDKGFLSAGLEAAKGFRGGLGGAVGASRTAAAQTGKEAGAVVRGKLKPVGAFVTKTPARIATTAGLGGLGIGMAGNGHRN